MVFKTNNIQLNVRKPEKFVRTSIEYSHIQNLNLARILKDYEIYHMDLIDKLPIYTSIKHDKFTAISNASTRKNKDFMLSIPSSSEQGQFTGRLVICILVLHTSTLMPYNFSLS